VSNVTILELRVIHLRPGVRSVTNAQQVHGFLRVMSFKYMTEMETLLNVTRRGLLCSII
jgi:hypothetical protein